MYRFILKLTIALCIMAFTTPANAMESRNLVRHGAWTVMLDIHKNGNLECSINSSADGASMSLSVNSDNQYFLYGFVFDVRAESSLSDILVHMGQDKWKFTNVETHNEDKGVFWFTALETDAGYRFRRDMMQNQSLWFDRYQTDIFFSLAGSAAAMRDLETCRQMIQPNA